MDLASNWDLFVEIGIAASVLTRLIRKAIPDPIEEGPVFRRLLHFLPVLLAGALLALVVHLPEGGPMWIHTVAIGGMSSNLRDLSVDLLFKAKAEKAPGRPAALEVASAPPPIPKARA